MVRERKKLRRKNTQKHKSLRLSCQYPPENQGTGLELNISLHIKYPNISLHKYYSKEKRELKIY